VTVAGDVSNDTISTWVGRHSGCAGRRYAYSNLRCFAGACFRNAPARSARIVAPRSQLLFRTIRGRAACLLELSMATMAASQMEKIMMAYCARAYNADCGRCECALVGRYYVRSPRSHVTEYTTSERNATVFQTWPET